MAARPTPNTPSRPPRADALRNIERILDAAVEELALDPDAGMAAVAQRAGLVRATVYVHFPTREALIAAVSDRAMAETVATIRSAAPDEGDPRQALTRTLTAAWRTLGRYHALVAITSRVGRASDHSFHAPVLKLLRPLVKRGQATGAFNPDVPTDWLLTISLELIHAASREVSAGRMSAAVAERALISAVLGAFAPPTERADVNHRSPAKAARAQRR
jgi:AcrR family transcriptional regulator